MRIGVSGYVGKKKTGIGRNLISVLEHILKIDSSNEYIIFANFDNLDMFDFNHPNVKVVPYKISKESSWGNLLWHQFVFPLIVIRYKVDLVYIPNFTFLLFKTKPTIVIIHDMIEFHIKNKFSKLKMLYRRIAVPTTAHLSDHIITVSENSKNDILKICKVKSDKVSVVYNSADSIFKPIPKKDALKDLSEFNLDLPYILYVGTLDHPGKNAYTLIKAFEILKRNNNFKGKLALVGMPGQGYDVIKETIKISPYEHDIARLGYVEDAKLNSLYNGAQVFVFPSLYEGFGIPPLEAMACGVPTIVANTSSLPEVVGQAGVLVDPLDSQALAENIEKIMKNDDCRQTLSSDAQEQAKKFSWEIAAKLTLELFEKYGAT